MVGAAGKNAAYAFTRSGTVWTEQAKLRAPTGAHDDAFGFSVAIDGDTLFVGAYIDDVGANMDQGSVYVFACSGNDWTSRLISPPPTPGERRVRLVRCRLTRSGGQHVGDRGGHCRRGRDPQPRPAYVFTRLGRPGPS